MTAVDRQKRPVLRFEGQTQANTHRWDKQGKIKPIEEGVKSHGKRGDTRILSPSKKKQEKESRW